MTASISQRPARVTQNLPDMERAPPLLFPPGDGPFRIKGTVLWGLFEYLKTRVPGGIDAVKEHLATEELREFCGQTFLASGWYDFLAVMHILNASGRAANKNVAQFISEHAVWQAQRDVRGVHRLLLKLASPEAVAKRFPIAFARYFDFAEISVEVSDGKSTVDVRGLPHLLFDWYRTSVGSAGAAILEVAGAKQLTVTYSPVTEDGKKHGVPTLRFCVTRTWTS
jgi:hypothetical protein